MKRSAAKRELAALKLTNFNFKQYSLSRVANLKLAVATSRKPQQVRLVIADWYPALRDALRRLLQAEPDLKIVGEASDGAEAVKLARQLKPDILLLDLIMPSTQA